MSNGRPRAWHVSRGGGVHVCLAALAPLNVPGTLADPLLVLFSGPKPIAQNDDWQDTQAAAIPATGLDPCRPNPSQSSGPPDCDLEAAILTTLNPGAYTVHLMGVNNATSVGLVEVFEIN